MNGKECERMSPRPNVGLYSGNVVDLFKGCLKNVPVTEIIQRELVMNWKGYVRK